jgi:general secretion pathway protein H
MASPGYAKRMAGFTLLELIVVLAIGAVIYSLLLGSPFGTASAGDLKAAARTLASGLRQAQSLAITSRRDASLVVDVEAREFRVADLEAHRVSDKVDLKLYTAQSEVVSERLGAIRFYPDGSSTGGRITVSSGERKYLVDVDWITGRVAINE